MRNPLPLAFHVILRC